MQPSSRFKRKSCSTQKGSTWKLRQIPMQAVCSLSNFKGESCSTLKSYTRRILMQSMQPSINIWDWKCWTQKGNMRESNNIASNVTMKRIWLEVLINRKLQYITVSNILASNVTIKQIEEEALLNTKRQYTKEETNTHETSQENLAQHKEVVLEGVNYLLSQCKYWATSKVTLWDHWYPARSSPWRCYVENTGLAGLSHCYYEGMFA